MASGWGGHRRTRAAGDRAAGRPGSHPELDGPDDRAVTAADPTRAASSSARRSRPAGRARPDGLPVVDYDPHPVGSPPIRPAWTPHH
ncbi:hypothetical protein NKG94_45890 [Micromonospora sp. M12]